MQPKIDFRPDKNTINLTFLTEAIFVAALTKKRLVISFLSVCEYGAWQLLPLSSSCITVQQISKYLIDVRLGSLCVWFIKGYLGRESEIYRNICSFTVCR